MSITDNNITEEEKISGYKANESGDETFALEQLDSYPGVLPDFSYVEEPIIPGESLFQDDEDIEEFDSEEDFGDLNEDVEDYDEANFDFGDDDESLNSEESLDEIPNESSFAGAFEDSDGENYDDPDSFSEYSDDDESDEEGDSNDDSGIETLSDEEIKALEGDSANDSEEQQGIELDDALKGLVEAELERSSGRASQEFNFDEYQESVSREDFPIDEDISANVMNFNDIDADKPSNFGIGKLPDEEENDKEDVKAEDKKPEKKKSSKKMIYIYSGVAAALLITLLTIAIFNKDTLFNNIGDETDSTLVNNIKEDTSNSKSITRTKSKNKENKAQKEITKMNEKDNSKSVSDEVNSNTESKNELVDDVTKVDKIDDKIAQNKSKKINLPKVEEVKEQAKSKKITSSSPKFKTNDKKEFAKLSNKDDKEVDENKAITKSTNNRKTNKKKITENKDIAKNNTEKATITKSSEVNNNVAYPKKEKSDEGLFIVQIYASQSKEDANYWLNKLKNQNINDAFISEQIVRDEVWYRVRFGSFVTKSEAMETASKLGYAQTWVDRVK